MIVCVYVNKFRRAFGVHRKDPAYAAFRQLAQPLASLSVSASERPGILLPTAFPHKQMVFLIREDAQRFSPDPTRGLSSVTLKSRTRGLQQQRHHTGDAFLLRWWEAVLSSCLPGQRNIGTDCIKTGLERSRASRQARHDPSMYPSSVNSSLCSRRLYGNTKRPEGNFSPSYQRFASKADTFDTYYM